MLRIPNAYRANPLDFLWETSISITYFDEDFPKILATKAGEVNGYMGFYSPDWFTLPPLLRRYEITMPDSSSEKSNITHFAMGTTI